MWSEIKLLGMDTAEALLLTGYFPFSLRVCFLVCHPFIQQMAEEVKRFVMNIAVNYQQHYIRESFVEVSILRTGEFAYFPQLTKI